MSAELDKGDTPAFSDIRIFQVKYEKQECPPYLTLN
jgi:hypothetical protein